jgi:bifunctional non-homologous end joining protein LigD
MALEKYKQKRDKSMTPEPFGGEIRDKNQLWFVIQKHAASRLHYDFRLEMEGVLKSWAVPKGPSLDPQVKHLAMMVEDHPYDYRTFEGIIPQGQYGGGTVIVWDEGTYEAEGLQGKPKKEQEQHLLEALNSGMLKFIMHGSKLKGSFALVKTKGRGENSWLLIKHKDEYATKNDITLEEKSVQSGLTLEQVKETSTNIYGKSKPKLQKMEEVEAQITKEVNPNVTTEDINDLLKRAVDAKMPTSIKPMLATLVDEPFDDAGWTFEIKWDGYRTISLISNSEVQLFSRNNKSFTEKYYPITKALQQWKLNAIIDGEVVVIGENGVSNFGALQNWRSEADGDMVMYVFDILWYEGMDLMDLTLIDRQAILKAILPQDNDLIRLSPIFPEKGTEFFEAAKKLGLEGIMAKKADSKYLTNFRSHEWLKIKVHKRQEVVIAGFTINEGTEKKFSSLLLGVYNHGSFEYAGKVGTGFSDKLQIEMMEQFKPLITKESPFEAEPDINQPSRFRPNPPKAKATWLKPELVCEVSYSEITSDGVFRHPSFKGMRSDKKAKDVVRETEEPTKEVVEEVKNETQASEPLHQKALKGLENKDRGTLLNPNEETQVKKINGHDLKFTHLSKIYWPDEGVTKRDMFNYYYQVAPFILPYLKDRPLSLNRFPNGITGKSFYQKDVKESAPDWAQKHPYTTSDGEDKEYLVGNDEATLLWAASLGCIEMNPWFSRVQAVDNPDYCVIDLDPDKNTFDQVIEAALVVKQVLDSLGVPSYPKTSGSTGMHIYIPLAAKYTYDQSQMFAKWIVTLVHQQVPEYTTLERMVSNRHGKMYLDFLQNRPAATIACAYSLRPKPGATVSMPLHWDEVKKGLTQKSFTIHNTIARLKTEGDLFKGVLAEGIDLEKILEKNQLELSEK